MNLPHIPWLKLFFTLLLIVGLFVLGGWFFDLARTAPLQSQAAPTSTAAHTAAVYATQNTQSPTPSEDTPYTPVALPEEEAEKKVVAITTPPAATNASMPVPEPPPSVLPRYTMPPFSFDIVHTATLPTIVNILCLPSAGAGYAGASGTGVVIDSRGIILTNAHIAQYLLLQNYPHENAASCVVRTGSPARAQYIAEPIAFPASWAAAHSGEYNDEIVLGTGENDWALLHITGRDVSAPKGPLPFITPDTRLAVTETSEQVFIAGYPAGFVGAHTIKNALWPVATIATVRELFTFTSATPDVFSVGGTIVAQGGTSGAPAVSAWGRLVGLAVTASEGETTNDRDLRFISLNHISNSVQQETGLTLAEFVSGDITAHTQAFATKKARLIELLTQEN